MNRVLKWIRAESAYQQGLTGNGVHVAVLDTGAYPHPAYKSRIVAFNDYQKGKKRPYDDNGHGTHVVGIVGGNLPKYRFQGVAPGCLLHVYKILNTRGNGKMGILTRAIWDILDGNKQNKIRILNISVGVLQREITEEYRLLQEAMDEAWKRGLVIVTAAGNNGPGENTVTLPGANKRVITVGCADDQGRVYNGNLRRGYSGHGPTEDCVVKPEVLVPGTNIRSCGMGLPTGFVMKSGTSMAAPVVSGMIALILEKYPELTPDEIKLLIYDSVTQNEGLSSCWGHLYMDDFLKNMWIKHKIW